MACLAPFVNKNEDPIEVLKLEELIAEGSFGTVYKGLHAVTRQVMAVKIIQLEEDETFDDLVIELEVMSKCHHENVVGYFGSWRKNDELFIGMELCDGGSAADIYQDMNKGLEEPEIAILCRETLKGIRYMHSVGFLHRDIKGANVLIKQDGSVKLVDFGVSSKLSASTPHRRTFIGTPYWMAPEVIENKGSPSPYDWKADVWSLGITMIELAQAEPPLSEMHPMKALFQIPYRNSPTLTKPGLWSQAFNDFVAQCLVKNQKQRASVDQLMAHPFVTGSTQYGVEVLENLVTRYLVVKKELELEEQKEPVEEQTEEEKSAQEMLEKIEQQKKLTSALLPLPPTPAQAAAPAAVVGAVESPVQQHRDKKHQQAAASQQEAPQQESKHHKERDSGRVSPLSAQASVLRTAPATTPPLVTEAPQPPPQEKVGTERTPTKQRNVSVDSPQEVRKQPTAETPSKAPQDRAAASSVAQSSPSSGPATSPAAHGTIPAERPTAAAQKNRPKTVHKGTARRTAEIKKNINRRLLKQQITEIKELTRQQQKEVDALTTRQADQKARLLKVATDKANVDQRRRVREDDQILKKLTAEREFELRKGKQDTEALSKTQLAVTKAWARDWSTQAKVQLKAFEDSVEERERLEKEAAKMREKEAKSAVVHKRIKEHLKQEQKSAMVQQREQVVTEFHHQQEIQHCFDEHENAMRLRDELCDLQLEQLVQRNTVEYATLASQQQRQSELLRDDQAAQVEVQTRLSDFEVENLKQLHALLHSQFERLKALELEQNKRQQMIEYRDFTKELRVAQKKKLDEFVDHMRGKKVSSTSSASASSGATSSEAQGLGGSSGSGRVPSRQEQKEKKDQFLKTIQEEGERCHQDKKNKMEEEDSYLRSHQEEQLRSLDKSQAEELKCLKERHAEIAEAMKADQRRIFEDVEARHCKERFVMRTVHQQEEARLRASLQEARRTVRIENQRTEAGLQLTHQQAEATQLTQHHQEQVEMLMQLHELQHQVKVKQFKKDTPTSVKDSEMQLLTTAQSRETELMRQAHAAAEHKLAERHQQQRTALSQTNQKQLHEDTERDAAANRTAASLCEADLKKIVAENEPILARHGPPGQQPPSTIAMLTSVGTDQQTGQIGAAMSTTVFSMTIPSGTPMPLLSAEKGTSARRSLGPALSATPGTSTPPVSPSPPATSTTPTAN